MAEDSRIEDKKGGTGYFRIMYSDLLLILSIVISTCYRLHALAQESLLISVYDPWFNYRASGYLVSNGVEKFRNWFDASSWYPYGRDIGRSMYPGMQYVLLVIYWISKNLGLELSVLECCYVECIFFGAVYTIFVYLLTKSFSKRDSSALLGALISSCSVSHLSRSVPIEYDNECVAVPMIMVVLTLWITAIRTGETKYVIMCTLAYHFLTMTWGGYIYAINVVALHVAILIAMGRYSSKLYTSYSILYLISTLLNVTIPVVGLSPIKSIEAVPTLGVFGLLQIARLYNRASKQLSKKLLLNLKLIGCALVIIMVIEIKLCVLKIFKPLTHRIAVIMGFKSTEPMLMAVSEHSKAKWSDIYWGISAFILPCLAGLRLAFDRLDEENLLIIIAFASSYFLTFRLVRIVVISTPLGATLTSDAICTLLHNLSTRIMKTSTHLRSRRTNVYGTMKWYSLFVAKGAISAMIIFWTLYKLIIPSMKYFEEITINTLSHTGLTTRVYKNSTAFHYTESFGEAYSWIRYNIDSKEPILSWWDYGYQTAAMADRPTYIDNNTNDFHHIAYMGLVLSSEEKTSYDLMNKIGAKYIMVYFLRNVQQNSDDIGKLFWIAACAEHDYPHRIDLSNYPMGINDFSKFNNSNITLYKLSVANIPINVLCSSVECNNGDTRTPLVYFEEVYSTDYQIIRLYKVKDKDPLGRSHQSIMSK